MQRDGTAALAAAHRIWARLEDVMNLIAAAAIFFLMFVGVFQVIGRTAFNTAIHGYIDYMEQASALFAFLGISYAQRVGAHIRMDLLLRGFSLRFMSLSSWSTRPGRTFYAPGSSAIRPSISDCRSGRPSSWCRSCWRSLRYGWCCRCSTTPVWSVIPMPSRSRCR